MWRLSTRGATQLTTVLCIYQTSRTTSPRLNWPDPGLRLLSLPRAFPGANTRSRAPRRRPLNACASVANHLKRSLKPIATTLISAARASFIRPSMPGTQPKKHTSFVFVDFSQAPSSCLASTSLSGRTTREHQSHLPAAPRPANATTLGLRCCACTISHLLALSSDVALLLPSSAVAVLTRPSVPAPSIW